MVDPDAHDPVELTVRRMAEMHAEHHRSATPTQRWLARMTSRLSHPIALPLALAVVLLWMAANLAAPFLRLRPVDGAPFALLELVATVFALFTTLMIMGTQRREEEAARHRSQLTLQLASLTEQKIAKVIELLEEQRRENPQLSSRADPVAEEMAHSADPRHVLERIKDTHEEG